MAESKNLLIYWWWMAYFRGMSETPVATWASWWPLEDIIRYIAENKDLEYDQ